MQPTRQTVHQVFDISRRLIVPLYQRAYVWEQEKHWEPFFHDIRTQARNCFHAVEGLGHFLGPIVTQAEMVAGGAHPRYNIIDGQQRLTTFQIFVKALHLIASAKGHWASNEFERLYRNPPRPHIGPEEIYKVWPTNSDRDTFQGIMEANEAAQVEQKFKISPTRLTEAFSFFYDSLLAFVEGTEEDAGDDEFFKMAGEKRIDALQQALTSRLYFIVLELETGDDPQVIFETLNARGEPLLPSDLIRNDLFLRVLRDRLKPDEIYRKYWVEFEERKSEHVDNGEGRFWHVMDTQGRLYRPRIDLFVFHWLTMKRAIAQQQDELLIANLYREFKKWTERQRLSSEEIFSELAVSRDDYARLVVPSGADRLSVTAARLKAIDTGTAHPLLLYLIGKFRNDLSNPELVKILNAIESYLVRRLLTRGTAKNYNKIFLSLLTKVAKVGPGVSLATFVEQELLSFKGPTAEWPDDNKLEHGILENPIYVRSRQDRVRIILIAAENHIRMMSGNKVEEALANSALSIEHILPQEPKLEDYPYPESHLEFRKQNESVEEARERVAHTLGNLTLLTQPLNSSVSNGEFLKKRAEIAEHSVLRLNKFMSVETAPITWDENSIVSRGRELFEHVRAIWPIPEKDGTVAATTVTDRRMTAKRTAMVEALSQREGVSLLSTSQAQYQSEDGEMRAVFSVSRRHEDKQHPYWYGYTDQGRDFLLKGKKSFFVLGCLDRDTAYALPNDEINKLADAHALHRTPERHWHIDLDENALRDIVLCLASGSQMPLKKYELRLKK